METDKEAQRGDTPSAIPSPARRKRPIGNEGIGREPRTVQTDIADSDKLARTGRKDEEVRDTPPAGDWNDIA